MNVFGTFCDTIFTPKKWFLSKKGPKEGERVARGHFHERVSETNPCTLATSKRWTYPNTLLLYILFPSWKSTTCIVISPTQKRYYLRNLYHGLIGLMEWSMNGHKRTRDIARIGPHVILQRNPKQDL